MTRVVCLVSFTACILACSGGKEGSDCSDTSGLDTQAELGPDACYEQGYADCMAWDVGDSDYCPIAVGCAAHEGDYLSGWCSAISELGYQDPLCS